MSKEWQSGEDGEIRFPLPFRVYDGTGKGKRRPLVLYFSGNAFGAAPPRLGDAPAAAAMAEAGALVVEADFWRPTRNLFPGGARKGFRGV